MALPDLDELSRRLKNADPWERQYLLEILDWPTRPDEIDYNDGEPWSPAKNRVGQQTVTEDEDSDTEVAAKRRRMDGNVAKKTGLVNLKRKAGRSSEYFYPPSESSDIYFVFPGANDISRCVPASRSILAARSEVFADAFGDGCSVDEYIEIRYVGSLGFRLFLEYIYTERVSEIGSLQAVLDCIILSKMHFMDDLKRSMLERIPDLVEDADGLILCLEYQRHWNDSSGGTSNLTNNIWKCLRETFGKNASHILSTRYCLLTLDRKQLSVLISCTTLNCSETTLLKGLIRWADQHFAFPDETDKSWPGEVRSILGDLLYGVNFLGMTIQELQDYPFISGLLTKEMTLAVCAVKFAKNNAGLLDRKLLEDEGVFDFAHSLVERRRNYVPCVRIVKAWLGRSGRVAHVKIRIVNNMATSWTFYVLSEEIASHSAIEARTRRDFRYRYDDGEKVLTFCSERMELLPGQSRTCIAKWDTVSETIDYIHITCNPYGRQSQKLKLAVPPELKANKGLENSAGSQLGDGEQTPTKAKPADTPDDPGPKIETGV